MDRMRVRTDLALEARESFDGSDTEVHGVVVEEEYEEELDLKITRVKILSSGEPEKWENRWVRT